MPSTSELGEDLAALVRAVGRALTQATPLSHRGAPAVATAFRLHFADGTVLKGNRLASASCATRVATLAPALGTFVPRVVAHGGRALLSEWVEGESLAGDDWPDVLLCRCGAAQAAAHAQAVETEDAAGEIAYRRRKLTEGLEVLVRARLLTADESAQLAALAAHAAPTSCAMGISLGDYCPDNIVCRPGGEPCLIDLETLSIASNDYDLGRTWYRWPMSAAQRAAFLDGYRAHRDPSPFLAHLSFWHTAALVEGAVFRHRQHRPDLPAPLAALRVLLDAGERRR
jgi:aminoglycoside phosphotransferase (APT) family kinase protein